MTVCKPHGGAPLLSRPSPSWSGYLMRQGVQSGTPLPLQQSPPAAERQIWRAEQNRIEYFYHDTNKLYSAKTVHNFNLSSQSSLLACVHYKASSYRRKHRTVNQMKGLEPVFNQMWSRTLNTDKESWATYLQGELRVRPLRDPCANGSGGKKLQRRFRNNL